MLVAVFFLHGMSPGFWVPALTNILNHRGLDAWVGAAFLVPPLCAIFAPLIMGALADQRVSADRLFAWSSLVATAFIAAAFAALDAGWHPSWFLALMAGYSLASTPSWGLLATISMTHLPHPERGFPLVRLGATFGWMAAGLVTSVVLQADVKPDAGYAAAAARGATGLLAFALPRTPPLGRANSWGDRFGLGAFRLLRQRDHAVFFATTAIFSIPLAAFYMHAPELLLALGDSRPTATMALGQVSEIFAMLAVAFLMTRLRVKTLLLTALGLSALRYLLSAYAGGAGTIHWHVIGISLHGVCYTFYFITAQVFLDRRVDPSLRGQAQGLLALVSGGVGPLVGALFCQWLKTRCLAPGGGGWQAYWGILAAIIAACTLAFALLYQGRRGAAGVSPR